MSGTLQRVLIVEDEPDIQEVARLALESVGGMDVTTCDHGEQALDLAATTPPDLILLDVMMPEMDGPATLQALRAVPATRGIPVVFLSAKAQPAEVRNYLELGALAVIAKPFDPMTLADQLRAIWSQRSPASP